MQTSTDTTTSILFLGDEVKECFTNHSDVVREVKRFCAGLQDSVAKIHTSPRIVNSSPLEWQMSVTSPRGRKTYVVNQKTPAGKIRILSA